MKVILALILFALLTVFSSGCAEIRIHRTTSLQAIKERQKEQRVTAVFGFAQFGSPTDLSKICSSNWQEIDTNVQSIQALMHVLTLNLYGPWTSQVECSAPKPPRVED